MGRDYGEQGEVPCRLPSLSPSISAFCSAFFLSAFPAPNRDRFSVGVGSAAALVVVGPSSCRSSDRVQFQLGERGWGPALGSGALRLRLLLHHQQSHAAQPAHEPSRLGKRPRALKCCALAEGPGLPGIPSRRGRFPSAGGGGAAVSGRALPPDWGGFRQASSTPAARPLRLSWARKVLSRRWPQSAAADLLC